MSTTTVTKRRTHGTQGGQLEPWDASSELSDAQLGMPQADPPTDLLLLGRHVSLERLKLTLRKAKADVLIRRAYFDGFQGCLVYWLLGVKSKTDLLAQDLPDEVGWAARRCVRFFDYGTLSNTTVIRVLDHCIQEREPAPAPATSQPAPAQPVADLSLPC